MFVRVKKIGSKRYAYLVEGIVRDGRVLQKVVCYLGPIVKLASGVPDDVKERVSRRARRVNWNRVNEALRDMPLTFEELSDMKKGQLRNALVARQSGRRDSGRGRMARVEGELSALTLIARNGFNEMFEMVGERKYRMR